MKKIKSVLLNLKGLFLSIFSLFVDFKKIKVFYGYFHWFFAKRYAVRRCKKWKGEWDNRGKHQGIFPYDDESLIVLSVLEIRRLKRNTAFTSNKYYRKYWKKHNYWNTSTGYK